MASKRTLKRREQRKRAKGRVFFGPRTAIEQLWVDQSEELFQWMVDSWATVTYSGGPYVWDDMNASLDADVARQREELLQKT